MKPYFYKIQEKSTGKYYVGCQYGKNADPQNFWNTYFTSCTYIKSKDPSEFNVIYVKERKDAKDYERKFLSRALNFMGRNKFENVFINRNLAPGILFTDDVRLKMSKGIKLWHSTIDRSGKNSTFYGMKHTDESKKKISSAKKDFFVNGGQHPKGFLGKQHSDDTKERIKQTAIEHSGMKGKTGNLHPTGGMIWWNNGSKHLRSKECPGDGWSKGRIFKKRKRQ